MKSANKFETVEEFCCSKCGSTDLIDKEHMALICKACGEYVCEIFYG